MDYEKKYKNLLERAIKRRDENCDGCKICLESLFDELRVSEDERIIKAQLDYWRSVGGKEWHGVPVQETIAWLEKQKDYVSPQMVTDAYLMGCNDTEKKWLEKQCEQDDYDDNIITRDDEILQAISVGLTDVLKDAGWSDFGGIPIEDIMDWLEKQGQVKEYTFKSLPRLLDMIEPTSKAKAYCQKLIDTLINEGYAADAKIVCECLKKMCGEKVALATMDEKQGEQKSADKVKVEPKFKVGDWIVWKDKYYKVNDNGCGYELIDTNGLSTSLEYGTVDENAHLWTVEDAKNGDVLATKNDVFIFKHMDKTRLFLCKSYCEVIGNSKLGLGFYFSINGVHPATKEQSDLLFQKMYEAGYEFDFNKKELKKTECLCISPEEYNKAVNECWGRNKSKWTDEDDYNVQCCIAKAECDIGNGCIGRNKELIEWLKSLKQRLI